MELKSPTFKPGGSRITKTASLPVCVNSGSYFDEYNTFDTFSGYFNGNSVVVDDPEEMKALYTMGCFGKASLSRGLPKFGKRNNNEPIVLKETQWKRRLEWSDKLKHFIAMYRANKSRDGKSEIINAPMEENPNPDIPMDVSVEEDNVMQSDEPVSSSILEANNMTKSQCFKDDNILVISDCNDVDNLLNLNPHIEAEPLKTVVEVLYLTLEEAFFLSFALGCLQIMDVAGKPLSLLETWRTFNCAQSDFVGNYVAYHYFRAKGWVVKSGIKFGGQFLLYKSGPAFHHASYVVLIQNIKLTDNDDNQKQLTWNKMNGFNRMAETCNKEIIIFTIQWPAMENEDNDNPLILKRFKVKESLLRRWQPCQEKNINN